MSNLIGDRKEGKRMGAGADVAAYCDARLGDANRHDRYPERWRSSLNQDVRKQL